MRITSFMKAIIGAVLAGLSTAGTEVAVSNHITAAGYIGIATSVVATFAGVYTIPNTTTDTHNPNGGVPIQ